MRKQSSRSVADNESPRVLVFNTGSNSLKFNVVVPQSSSPQVVAGQKLLSGVIEPIGGDLNSAC
jgi:acetate kinase